MKDHTGTKRGYIWSSKAWYAKAAKCDHEIMFGLYDPDDGGTTGEMAMRWEWIGNNLVPQLQVFDDGWSALSSFSDLIKKMGEVDGETISEPDFVELLKSCGFEDLTTYTNPYTDESNA